jgi:hypothetical protein
MRLITLRRAAGRGSLTGKAGNMESMRRRINLIIASTTLTGKAPCETDSRRWYDPQ